MHRPASGLSAAHLDLWPQVDYEVVLWAEDAHQSSLQDTGDNRAEFRPVTWSMESFRYPAPLTLLGNVEISTVTRRGLQDAVGAFLLRSGEREPRPPVAARDAVILIEAAGVKKESLQGDRKGLATSPGSNPPSEAACGKTAAEGGRPRAQTSSCK